MEVPWHILARPVFSLHIRLSKKTLHRSRITRLMGRKGDDDSDFSDSQHKEFIYQSNNTQKRRWHDGGIYETYIYAKVPHSGPKDTPSPFFSNGIGLGEVRDESRHVCALWSGRTRAYELRGYVYMLCLYIENPTAVSDNYMRESLVLPHLIGIDPCHERKE